MSNYARTSMVLAGILTVLFAGPVPRASADNNDDPVVLNAVADLSHNQLVINGRDFDGRGSLHVLLNGVPLTVVSATPTRIVAALAGVDRAADLSARCRPRTRPSGPRRRLCGVRRHDRRRWPGAGPQGPQGVRQGPIRVQIGPMAPQVRRA